MWKSVSVKKAIPRSKCVLTCDTFSTSSSSLRTEAMRFRLLARIGLHELLSQLREEASSVEQSEQGELTILARLAA